VPYLGALNLGKDDMIQALGLSFTVSTIALALALTAGGAFALGDIGASTAALAPALLGMAAGGALRGRFSEKTFRRVFFGGLPRARRSSRIEGAILTPGTVPYWIEAARLIQHIMFVLICCRLSIRPAFESRN
jgi:hypothetical protein